MNVLVMFALVIMPSGPASPEAGPSLGQPESAARMFQRALLDGDFATLDRLLKEEALHVEKNEATAFIKEALGHKDPLVRHLAAYAQSQIDLEESKKNLTALIESLDCTEPRVRARSAYALGEIGPSAGPAVPSLTRLLGDPNPRVRAGAARALGLIGPSASQNAIPLLAKLLGDPEPPVRGITAVALGWLGPAAASAASPLRALQVSDPDASVRAAAASALESIVPSMRGTIDALTDRDPQHRLQATTILTQMGPAAREAVPYLIETLRHDDNADVQAGAAYALGRIGPEARYAVPVLILALKNPSIRVRTGSALALGLLGPAASGAAPALAERLRDDDAVVAGAAATALGNLGPAAEQAVPFLIDLLRDGSALHRQRAIDVLARIGPGAKAATRPLLDALKDRDPLVRRDAARALVSVGPQPSAEVAALIEAIQYDKDPIDRTVRAWAALSLAAMGPPAAEAVEALVTALQDSDTNVRAVAALALGKIGQAAVPALVKGLEHIDPQVRAGAAVALGSMGAGARRAVPMLRDALRDEDSQVGLAAAISLARIADGLRFEQDTRALPLLEETLHALESVEHSSGPRPPEWKAAGDQVRAALRSLKTVERAHALDRVLRSSWFPWLAGGLGYVIGMLSLWFALLWLRPLTILRVNDALRSFPHMRVPGPFGGLEVSLRGLLLVRLLHFHPRVLDAWVAQCLTAFRQHYPSRRTVQDRSVYVPVPVILDGQVIAVPTARQLGQVFNRQRGCLLVWGEGGAGKTTFACQLGRWALAPERSERLCDHIMLPVLIEHELDLNAAGGKPGFQTLTEAVRGQLQAITGDGATLSEELLERLLRQRRVLVVIDHFSEIGPAARDAIHPGHADFPAHALVVTSRREETLDGVPRSAVQPLRIEGNRLSSFLEAYLVQRGKRQLFTDAEYFEACRRLALLVSGRDITPLLARLFAEQLIAQKEARPDGNLPANLPDLMLGYVHELNRALAETNRRSDFEVQRDAGILAWESLQSRFHPEPVPLETALRALGSDDAKERLAYLETELRLIRTIEPACDRICFTLDPLAEYLAALHLVHRNRANLEAWKELVGRASALRQENDAIQSFLQAIRDCCAVRKLGTGVLDLLDNVLAQAA